VLATVDISQYARAKNNNSRAMGRGGALWDNGRDRIDEWVRDTHKKERTISVAWGYERERGSAPQTQTHTQQGNEAKTRRHEANRAKIR